MGLNNRRGHITHAQVLRRMRKQLKRTLVAELAKHGVTLLPGSRVKYGDLVATAIWQFDYGNLCLYSNLGKATWLNARASTPDVNAEEPVYVGVHVSVLLNMGR